MLMNILKRAKELTIKGISLPCSYYLKKILNSETNTFLDVFSKLDDFDIFSAIKEWCETDDLILKTLSLRLVNRNLLKIEIFDKKISKSYIKKINKKVANIYPKIKPNERKYLVFSNKVINNAYNHQDKINLLYKNDKIIELSKAADQMHIKSLSKTVTKYFICYPK